MDDAPFECQSPKSMSPSIEAAGKGVGEVEDDVAAAIGPFVGGETAKLMRLNGKTCLGVWKIAAGVGGVKKQLFMDESLRRKSISSVVFSSKSVNFINCIESFSSRTMGEMFSKCMLGLLGKLYE